jgi:putative transposase
MWDQHFYRRHMPHFQNVDRVYLVTFVTWNRWVLPPEARDISYAEVIRQQDETAFVHTAVVMPDHVHMVMQPLWDSAGFIIALPKILRLIKGRSARAINVKSNRSGAVWQQESNDHQIRSEESLIAKCEYVAQNPVRAGLCARPEDYPWLWRWWMKTTTG